MNAILHIETNFIGKMDGSMKNELEYFMKDFSEAISETLDFLTQLESENLSSKLEGSRQRIYHLLENVNKQSQVFQQHSIHNNNTNEHTKIDLNAKKSSLETLHLKGLCEPHTKSRRKHGHQHNHHRATQNGGDSVFHVPADLSPSSEVSPSRDDSSLIPEISLEHSTSRDVDNALHEISPETTTTTTPDHDHVWSRSSMSTKRRYFDGHDDVSNETTSKEDEAILEGDDVDSADDMPEPEVTPDHTEMTSTNFQTTLPTLTIERALTPSSSSDEDDDINNTDTKFLGVTKTARRNIRKKSVTADVKQRLRKYLKMEMRGTFDVSMIDLLDPDFSGWLVDQADDINKWCVINDMLFCIFENDQSKYATNVFVLPACAVREVVFRSSAPHPGTGITMTRKYQIVVSSVSNEKETVFAADSILDHNEWLLALRHAIDHSTDIYPSDDSESDVDADSVNSSTGSGYDPTPNDRTEPQRYNPTAKGSVTRDQKLHQEKTGAETTLFTRTVPGSGESQLSSSSSSKAPSTEESEEEGGLAPLPVHKPAGVSPTPQRRVSYLMATEHHKNQASKQKQSKQSKSLMDIITPKLPRPKGFAGIKLPRSPTPLRKNAAGKKAKIVLESLKGATLATYLKLKDNNKVVKSWCVLHEGKLYTFKTKNQSEKCEFCLDVDKVEITDKVGFEFKVNSNDKDHVFAAQDRYDFSRWIRELLPGCDVIVPNVALSSALRGTTESFCLDDGVRRSLEDLVDLRSQQTIALKDEGSHGRKIRGTPAPVKRFSNDAHRHSTGHLLTNVAVPSDSTVRQQRKSKDDTYSAEIIKAIHSNPLEPESVKVQLTDLTLTRNLGEPCNGVKKKLGDVESTRKTSETILTADQKCNTDSEEIIIPKHENTVSTASPLLNSNPMTLTLKTDLNLCMSTPGTESPGVSEYLAYSAASELSSDDDLGIASSVASSWMNSLSPSSSGRFSEGTMDIYTENARLETEVSECWHRQRRSGSLESPLRSKLSPHLLKRHFSDNSLKRGSVGPLDDTEQEEVPHERQRKRSSSVNIPTDYPKRITGERGPLPQYGVVRSTSSDSFHNKRPSTTPEAPLEGRVEIVDENGNSRSFWGLYDDLTLALYTDEVAVDPEILIPLSRCMIEMEENGPDGRSFVKVSQKDRGHLSLFAGSNETCRRWHDIMKDDVMKLAIEGLNLEDSGAREFQNLDAGHHEDQEKARKFREDLAKIRKEQLLNELLHQKHELELKQLKRRPRHVTTPGSPVPSHANSVESDVMNEAEEVQMVRDITHLKQRRISTQIKVDTIQKQLNESQKKNEKRFFKFISKKPEIIPDNKPKKDHLEANLKELTGKLETISESLTKQQTEQERLKKRHEKRLHNSFSSSDMSKHHSLSKTVDSHRTTGSSEDLRPSASLPASRMRELARPRSHTFSPPGPTPKPANTRLKRLSEPPRTKPKYEIDPNALAEIEEFEQMSKMFLRQHSDGFRV